MTEQFSWQSDVRAVIGSVFPFITERRYITSGYTVIISDDTSQNLAARRLDGFALTQVLGPARRLDGFALTRVLALTCL